MVELFCALIGGNGSAFPVTIEESETVSHLKEAIKLEKENDLKAIDADKLQLFLAKKDGAWLKENNKTDTMLLGEFDTTTYMLMRGSWKLNKPNLFVL